MIRAALRLSWAVQRILWPHGLGCYLIGCKQPAHAPGAYPTWDEHQAQMLKKTLDRAELIRRGVPDHVASFAIESGAAETLIPLLRMIAGEDNDK